MTASHSVHVLLKLEMCIPISHVTLETVPKYANIERPTFVCFIIQNLKQLYKKTPYRLIVHKPLTIHDFKTAEDNIHKKSLFYFLFITGSNPCNSYI